MKRERARFKRPSFLNVKKSSLLYCASAVFKHFCLFIYLRAHGSDVTNRDDQKRLAGQQAPARLHERMRARKKGS